MNDRLDTLVSDHAHRAAAWLTEERDRFAAMTDEIWELAEPGLAETRSAEVLIAALEEAGFAVERDVSGMPSGFVARFGDAGPTIGLAAEYDATPGETQDRVPYPAARPGRTAGFTDLHNGIGVASVAAAVALARAVGQGAPPVRLVVFGTPAEKLCVGKPFMARDGHFDGLDAVVAWHPRKYTTAEWEDGPGIQTGIVVEFTGRTSYSARPWDGVNALDATMLMDVVLSYLRDRVPRSINSSISRIVMNGGLHPTSVPGSTASWYIARANSVAGLGQVRALVERAAAAAALATGATERCTVVSATRPWLPNDVLTGAGWRGLQRAGAPSFSAESKEFGRSVLREVGRDDAQEPFDESLTPPWDRAGRDFAGGADDVTEFCWHAPTVRLYVAHGLVGEHLPNWARSAFTGIDAAHATVIAAARAMVYTVADLVENPEVLEAAREEWQRRVADGGALGPLIPADAAPPVEAVGIPPFLLHHLVERSGLDTIPIIGESGGH